MGSYNNFYLVFTQFHQLLSITAIQRYRQWPLHRTLLLIIHGAVCVLLIIHLACSNPLVRSTTTTSSFEHGQDLNKFKFHTATRDPLGRATNPPLDRHEQQRSDVVLRQPHTRSRFLFGPPATTTTAAAASRPTYRPTHSCAMVLYTFPLCCMLYYTQHNIAKHRAL